MANIPVRQRQRSSPWLWIAVSVVLLLIALVAIDYFVTNLVFNQNAQPQARQPIGALMMAVVPASFWRLQL